MKQHPLQKWRLDNNITMSAAAKKAGITRMTWYRWERGIRQPRLRTLPKVLRLTGLKAEQFMGGA